MENPNCDKCGSKRINIQYKSHTLEPHHKDEIEYILCTCRTCKHDWEMKVKDATVDEGVDNRELLCD
jgi:DNA-directed RNA polymerase subunit M/transcription elongation factor TFIIS